MLGPPTSVLSNIIDKTNVNLAWSSPSDPNDILLEYRVIYYGFKDELAIVRTDCCAVVYVYLLHFTIGY